MSDQVSDKVLSVSPETPVEEIMAILDRDGAVILERALDSETMDAVQSELFPYMQRAYKGEGDFWGFETKRIAALVAKSPTFARRVAPHPKVMEVMDRLLLPRCERYHLHVTQAVAIGPGEKAQIMHRDDGLMPFTHPGPQVLCNTMWALTDFTGPNGATNIILGSHLWDDERAPGPEDRILQAEMPRGSVLIYVGSIWHGGGVNRTEDDWRIGMICGYSLGWLRQEENQYLAVPPAIAKDLPDEVQRLIGYALHGSFLGWYEGQDPHVVLEPHVSDVMPSVPEGGDHTEDTRILKTASFIEPRRITM